MYLCTNYNSEGLKTFDVDWSWDSRPPPVVCPFWTIGKQVVIMAQTKGTLSEQYLEIYLSYQLHETWFVDQLHEIWFVDWSCLLNSLGILPPPQLQRPVDVGL